MKKYISYLLIFIILFSALVFLFVIYTTHKFISQKTEFSNKKTFIAPDTTEVYILGVVHKPTNGITYDSLYNTLERIKPNIILYEYDSSAFNRQMNLKVHWSFVLPPFLDKFRQNNLEEISVTKYLYHNSFAIVRPYEWELREKFHKENNIISKPDEIFQALAKLQAENKLTFEQKKILDDYYTLSDQLEKFGDSTMYEINTDLQDSIAEERQNSQYHKIKLIIDNNNYLQQYRNFCKINKAYWHIRNKAMADNIQKYIRLYPQSRIVVLNGYFHRYYLKKELFDHQDDLNFRLKNIKR